MQWSLQKNLKDDYDDDVCIKVSRANPTGTNTMRMDLTHTQALTQKERKKKKNNNNNSSNIRY